MLQLKNIYKSYTTGGSTQIALDGINVKFRQNEFVVILGPSGSGKTTFLNIIGGLERYDKGDMIVKSHSTKSFTKEEWDFYRNNNIGFIFKEYNLIPHLSILENVQIAIALTDLPAKEKRQMAIDALEKVGIKDYISRNSRKLSKEEMQRVAIARALVNNPDIILADEPAGNLDGKGSLEIMNLIKDVFKNKLVIVVTQNQNFAKLYATRVIHFRDAEIIYDSNPLEEVSVVEDICLDKTRISFTTSFRLAVRDLSNKKGKTSLCILISGINVAIIAIILALITGFNEKINNYENNTLNDFPIVINKRHTDINSISKSEEKSDFKNYIKEDVVYPYNMDKENKVHNNYIDEQYLNYIKNMDENLFSAISYQLEMNINILRKDENGEISLLDDSELNFYSYPEKLDNKQYLQKNYDLLYGYYPTSKEDVVLVLDENNRMNEKTLNALGINYDRRDSINFDEIVGKEMKVVSNDDYYKKSGEYFYIDDSQKSLEKIYSSDKSTTISITGILRPKADSNLKAISEGILYSNELCNYYIEDCKNSEIVKEQKALDYNIMTGQSFKKSNEAKSNVALSGINILGDVTTSNTKEDMLCLLGDSVILDTITIYPKDFESKNVIVKYLDNYNHQKAEDEKIYYTDTSTAVGAITGGILSCIILIFMCFGAGNLCISIIMIAMITYISINDRRKEISVFKLLGARDKDIHNLFNVQVALIGFLSGVVGITLSYIAMIPINSVLNSITSLSGVAFLEIGHVGVLILVSILISVLGSLLPKHIALRKDFVKLLKKY